MLGAAGVDGYEAMYLSCEVGASKRDGTIWQVVLERERIAKGRLLHLGDDPLTDAHMPITLGFNAVHLISPGGLFDLRSVTSGRPARGTGKLLLGPSIAQAGNDPLEGR